MTLNTKIYYVNICLVQFIHGDNTTYEQNNFASTVYKSTLTSTLYAEKFALCMLNRTESLSVR